ncbi:histidine phosphatase family protein [Compostibacter hankyongensis]|uniref:Phosphoglycerate mutase family protein n=1 Tax=Compostibacter hankyongensis TaxID=1007089 RepID=A0ABP8G8E4_9BACT
MPNPADFDRHSPSVRNFTAVNDEYHIMKHSSGLILFWIMAGLFVAGIAGCKRTAENSVTHFYIVRHAERYPGFEGSLTWYGRLRAGDLMRKLQDSGIGKIYVTPFVRTVQTADSLRLLQRIDTACYLADTSGRDLLRSLTVHKDYGKRILIVGHANTLPGILRSLGVKEPLPAFPDTVYNRLFEVVNDHGKVSLRSSSYGRPSLPPAPAP